MPKRTGGGSTFSVQPLTERNFKDLEDLFGQPGGSIVRGCWCMHYRRTGSSSTGKAGTSNKRELLALASSDRPPGLVGYLDGEPVGWISLGPRADYLRLQRSPVMKPIDDEPVWSLVCSFVAKSRRGIGIQHRLLAAAIDFARRSGATILESYPVDKPERSHDDFMFFGSRSLYEAAGFRYVQRRSPTRCVMRLDLIGNRTSR